MCGLVRVAPSQRREVFCISILIPSTYLLKTDAIKEIVVTGGWIKPFKDSSSYIFELILFSGYLRCCNTRNGPSYQARVGPMEEIGMDVIPPAELVRKWAVRKPIPTISGTIRDNIIIEEL
jgi:hypothetical protein